jgi:hypothetical protein
LRPDRKRLRVAIPIVAGVLCLVAAVAAASYWHRFHAGASRGASAIARCSAFSNLDHDLRQRMLIYYRDLTTIWRAFGWSGNHPNPPREHTTIDPRQPTGSSASAISPSSLQRMSHQARIQVQLIDAENGGLL